MKIISDIEEANRLLSQYVNAYLEIITYTDTFKRMAISLKHPKFKEIVYIIGVGCDKMIGNEGNIKFVFDSELYWSQYGRQLYDGQLGLGWDDVNLSIIEDEYNDFGEVISVMKDHNSKFELRTSQGFVVAQGFETEFGEPFDEGFFK